uniref:Uncharacterized protein n=1 Tax=Utricularia reniformis TaxID=192314 RepID=A0A1Y0AZR7_9LAMI|nr:hypothetical protein AEK19_MT0357 [Utricularia reniformis]ART30629.1 hypothetical protein AEK19_MT0357 [Utricularia reniformis]
MKLARTLFCCRPTPAFSLDEYLKRCNLCKSRNFRFSKLLIFKSSYQRKKGFSTHD